MDKHMKAMLELELNHVTANAHHLRQLLSSPDVDGSNPANWDLIRQYGHNMELYGMAISGFADRMLKGGIEALYGSQLDSDDTAP